jgi:hypothetical protein
MRRGRSATGAIAGALAILLIGLAATPAQASVETDTSRNARYCEIFTIFLAPSPIARINNTLGLNRCRQGWWDSLDTAALAEESGADLVLLNGPRNFLMDKVKVTNPGPISEFAGKRLREVATIDLSKIGLAPPPAFTNVQITRTTKFTFLAHKRVFELTDPDGRTYVMQSYAQIVDPDLSYDELRGLGPRVGLPDGWTYRSYKPRRNIVLRAQIHATIVQDELKNTYQRVAR